MHKVLVGLVGLLLVTVGLSPAAAAQAPVRAPVVPDTPVGRQVGWLIGATHHLPISGTDAAQHIEAGVIAAEGIDQLNAILGQIAGPGGLSLAFYTGSQETATAGVTGAHGLLWLFDVAVGASGLIEGLNFRRPIPTSWGEIHDRMRALGPDVSFLAARLDHGGCRPVDELAASTARPLGSAFKLYVLGALAQAVKEGDAAWDQPLAIRDDWKSFPSGVLQTLHAGTKLSLGTYADEMISISDNTAADHLINFLGQTDIEHQLARFRMAKPGANRPFLTTRELFQLKLNRYPSLANQFLALRGGQRSIYLRASIDPMALPLPGPWLEPRAIDTIEWFASPSDICRAYAGLDRQSQDPALSGVGHALSINDGGIPLDRDQWSRVWFKGGSEPGVLTLNYLATTMDGRTFVVSAMISNPTVAFDENYAAIEALTLVDGALMLVH